MPIYRVETNQGTFDVEADREPTVDELQQHLAGQAAGKAPPAENYDPGILGSIKTYLTGTPEEKAKLKAYNRAASAKALNDMTLLGALTSGGGAMPGPNTVKDVRETAAIVPRAAGAVLGAEGGPTGAAINAGGESLGQLIEGKADPGEVGRAAVIGSVPFGKAAGVVSALKNALKFGAANAGGEEVKSLINTGQPAPVEDVAAQGAIGAGIPLGVQAGGKVVAKAAGIVQPEDVAKVQAAMSRNAKEDATLAAMQAKGAVIRPSRVSDSKLNKLAESIAGPTALEQKMSAKNAEVFNAAGRREAGVPVNVAMDEAVMESARGKLAAPYEELRAISQKEQAKLAQLEQTTPQATAQDDVMRRMQTIAKQVDPYLLNAEQNLKDLKQVRGEANAAWRTYNNSPTPTPDLLDKAHGLTAKADEIENSLEKAAQASGKPQLVEQLRAARKALAKNYEIADNLNAGSGDVNVRGLTAKMNALGEGSMSGENADMARFGAAFPDESRPRAGLNTSPSAVTAGTGLLAASSAGSAPAALAKGGIPFLRGPIQEMILSPEYQAQYAKRDYSIPNRMDPETLARVTKAILNQRKEDGNRHR